MNEGWICTSCRRSYAPWVSRCTFCPAAVVSPIFGPYVPYVPWLPTTNPYPITVGVSTTSCSSDKGYTYINASPPIGPAQFTGSPLHVAAGIG